MGAEEKEQLLKKVEEEKKRLDKLIDSGNRLKKLIDYPEWKDWEDILKQFEDIALDEFSCEFESEDGKTTKKVEEVELRVRQKKYNTIRQIRSLINRCIKQSDQARADKEELVKKPEMYLRVKHKHN